MIRQSLQLYKMIEMYCSVNCIHLLSICNVSNPAQVIIFLFLPWCGKQVNPKFSAITLSALLWALCTSPQDRNLSEKDGVISCLARQVSMVTGRDELSFLLQTEVGGCDLGETGCKRPWPWRDLGRLLGLLVVKPWGEGENGLGRREKEPLTYWCSVNNLVSAARPCLGPSHTYYWDLSDRNPIKRHEPNGKFQTVRLVCDVSFKLRTS